MELRRSRLWRALVARPVGVSLRTSSQALASMLTVVGALVVVSTKVRGGGASVALEQLGPGALSLSLAVVIFLWWRRLPVWSFFLGHAVQSAALGWGVRAAGSASSAMAWASLFVVLLIESFFVLSWLEAGFEFGLGVAWLIWALHQHPGVEVADDVLVVGVLVATCAVAGWLVRAADRADLDQLTGVPNRRGVRRQAEALLLRAHRRARPVGLALIDLDHFKAVNDALGHAGGDQLLQAVATTARRTVPAGAVFGRWGGDEFALLVPAGSAEDVIVLVDQVRAGLPPGRSMSVGVGMWEAGEDLDAVVQRADQALYQVKRSFRGVTQVFGEGFHGPIASAVATGELELHYQPVVRLGDGAVTGAEALVRWRRPGHGLVPPAEFVPRAEATGEIIALGRWALRRACADAARWPALPDGRPRTVAVNASGRELAEPEYAEHVLDALHRAGLPAGALTLEITEGVLDLESSTVADTLHALRVAGVRLAIDDFGTGYSSLSRLGRLPLDYLKIDRSFVAPIGDAVSDVPLVSSILALARSLGMRVIAEGVEQPHQALWLTARGCDEGQGYLWSRPVPVEQFGALLTVQAGGDRAVPSSAPAAAGHPSPR